MAILPSAANNDEGRGQMGKFKVGDRVRRVGSGGGVSMVGLTHTIEEGLVNGEFILSGLGGTFTEPYLAKQFEAVESATPTYTIEHVIPLIKDARQLDHATHIVCDRGGNTDLMEKMLRDVYAEIGEKVSRAVEVDA